MATTVALCWFYETFSQTHWSITMKTIIACFHQSLGFLLSLLVFGAFSVASQADDFSGRYLDDAIWADQEVVRRIRHGRFIGGFRQTNRTANGRLFIANPSSVFSLKAKMRVLRASTTGPSPRAYIAGIF